MAGCVVSAHKMKVMKDRPEDAPHFSRVAIPPFENAAGNALPADAGGQLAAAVRSRLAESHEEAFDEITATAADGTSALVVQGRIIGFEPGKGGLAIAATWSGAGSLELEITVLEGQSARVLEQFRTTATISYSVQGDTMNMRDMVAGPAAVVASRVAEYGIED
jgi:hypothetical protein